MVDKVHNTFSVKNESEEDKNLSKLNFLLYILITCICLYGFLILYKKTDDIKQSQEYIRSVVTFPLPYQLGGHTNQINTAFVSTNITKEPVSVKIDEKLFTSEKSYSRGDIVFVKYFNIYGVIEDKVSDDYYKIIYRDNNHRLDNFEIPVDFLLRPSQGSLTPFTFTP